MFTFISNLIKAQDNARLVRLLLMSEDSILKQNKALKKALKDKQEEVYDYAYGENELIKKIAKLEGKQYKTASQTQAEMDEACLNFKA